MRVYSGLPTVFKVSLLTAYFLIVDYCSVTNDQQDTPPILFVHTPDLTITHFTLVSSIISFWGIALPIGYLLATRFNFGGPGLWSGMAIGAGFSMSLLFWRFNSKIQGRISKLNI